MTYIWIAVIVVVILYTLYLIRFNKTWSIIATTFTDEDYFAIVELLRSSKVKFITKTAIDWGRPPGQRTIVDHRQVDFYVRKQDKYIAKQTLSKKNF